MKMNDNDYKEHLLKRGFNKEDIRQILEQRSGMDYCSVEMFNELVKQGVVKRTRKLRNNRTLYVNSDGCVMYLDYYWKKYNYCGYFIN